jgi:hypothetical protein
LLFRTGGAIGAATTIPAVSERSQVPYLSAVAIYYNEADYLREWIEFHKLVGFERFFLYDHESTDHRYEVLEPYIADGTVVHYDWPINPGQPEAYQDVLERHREDTFWLGVIDLDELLFSPTGAKVSEVLRDFEQFPGVAVNSIAFGTSGHVTKQPGLVIENYVRRCEIAKPRNCIIKSIVRPTEVEDIGSDPHYFRYRNGQRAVTENKEPLRGSLTEAVSVELLRVNHYITRSQEERDAKIAGLNPWVGGDRHLPKAKERDKMLNDEEDTTILRYAPALREAMGLSEVPRR